MSQAWTVLVAGTLLLCAARPALAAPARPDPAQLQAVLEQNGGDGLELCREPGIDLEPDELPLCSLAPAARARCPGFDAACQRAQAPSRGAREDAPSWWSGAGELARVLGSLLFWGLVALCGGLLARVLWMLVRARRVPATAEAEPTAAMAAGSIASPPLRGSAEQHLARARALADAGDVAGALGALHLSAVLGLDAQGLIAAQPGRTNGDYARELGPQPQLRAAFRELSRVVEAVQFGARRPEPGAFERALRDAAPLLGPLGHGALLLVLGAALLLAACSPGAPGQGRASAACGTGAGGYSVLCDLLALSGSVQRRYRPLAQIDDTVDTLVVLGHEPSVASASALHAWVQQGGLLVLAAPSLLDDLLGVRRPDDSCGHEGWLVTDGVPPLVHLGPPAGEPRLVAIGPSLIGPWLTPDAICPSGELYIGHESVGEGRVLYLPTAALLSNASLLAGDNARLLLGMIAPAQGATEIVGDWTRQVAESPLGALRAAGLLPWLWQLLLLGLAYALYRGAPFGRRRAAPEPGRRRFSEHAVALGERWEEAGAARTALGAYGAFALELLRERLPVGSDASDELARHIAEKTGRPAQQVAEALEQARRARQPGAAAGDEAEQLGTLRALGHIIEEIGGPR